jgi:hypothetical protein
MTEEDKAYFDSKFAELKTCVDERADKVIEASRAMQTELLRGFQSFSTAQTIRLRKLEADQSNLDAAISGRVGVLEDRLHQIEMRLGITGL